MSRGLAQRLTKSLGQQVIVDNRPSAGGTLGASIVAQSNPDGYTLLVASAGVLSVAPSVYTKLPFDPIKDFAPIALFAETPYVMAVNNSVKATNVEELIALAKSKAGGINFGSSGSGGSPHLCGELLKSISGANMTHVPYKGGAAATLDLIGGQIDMFCTGMTALAGSIKDGKVRAIGMATAERSELMPTLPTIAEQGLPGFSVSSWSALVAPAKTPQPVLRKIGDAVAAIMKSDDMKQFVLSTGSEAAFVGPKDFTPYLKTEIAKWAKVVKAAKIESQ